MLHRPPSSTPRNLGSPLSAVTILFVLTFSFTVAIPVDAQTEREAPASPKQAEPKAADQKPTPPTTNNPARPGLPDVSWKPVSSADAVKKAIDRGCNFLIDNQRPDGAYGFYPNSDVGITAMALHALATSPRAYREEDGPFISKAVEYILSQQQPDGGIYEKGQGLENYKTSIAICALAALDEGRKKPRYAEQIARAREYVQSLQSNEKKNYEKDSHKPAYGGIGYGSDRRPDMSNTQFGIEALRAAGLSEDSDEFRRAVIFLQRCQNAKSNDLFEDQEDAKSTDDGGFMYSPGSTKAETIQNPDGTVSYSSYGSMTYAGVKSYILSGLTMSDPRVQSAWQWICEHFTVEQNPGMATPKNAARGWQGLFYYYLMLARTMEVLDIHEVPTPDGKRLWAQELAGYLIALQGEDGSWSNPVDRWWEGDPALATAYATRALGIAIRYLDTKP